MRRSSQHLSSLLYLSGLVCLSCLASPSASAETPKPKTDKSWDIEWPSAPAHFIEVDVDEGTWMSVDVSPDGAWIIFDLLGDLYRIPSSGGEATLLRGGHSWEMQPRYSPDGRWIAFTSDEGGGDNLWVMSADPVKSQAEAWPVSEERYRLVNSPTWTPDGQALIGRKHFTSRRSLGAGEMWRYHWRGGYAGVQLTRRSSDQKDEGEPAISPDGRWLYYSQDLSGGSSFEYNKDSHAGIYGIKRLDLMNGATRLLTGGAGGAIRPTPSPDGAHLAFIRRVEGESTLWVRALASGRERMLVKPLERDLQETWAIHGVYPQIAWTPDSAQIVYWARGKLWRVDRESAQVSEIPFHVRQRHRLITPQRTPRRIATEPDSPVRLLRWVRHAEHHIVFQALGHLYLMDKRHPDRAPRALAHHGARALPKLNLTPKLRVLKPKSPSADAPNTGEGSRATSERLIHPDVYHARELSAQEGSDDPDEPTSPQRGDHSTFALSPSWSTSGALIIYATWSDQTLGQIRALDLTTGQDEELSSGPGHYLNPLLSADEQWLIYQRVGGGWITPPRYVGQPGLYALHLPSGYERRLAGSVESPHLGPDPRRVYFTKQEGKALILASAPLEVASIPDAPPPPHEVIARGEKLQAARLSPNGRWVAFQSDFNLWVTSRPSTGRALKLSTSQKDRPLFKLSDRSGFDPQWSRDSERLSWRLGAALSEVSLPDELLRQDPRALTSKALIAQQSSQVETLQLELSTPRPAPQSAPIALVGGHVLTLATGLDERRDLIERGIVVVEGERITQVGAYDDLISTLSPETLRVDVTGHTVVPGLIDVHAHGSYAAYGITPQVNWQRCATLTFGVTSVHDPSHHSDSVFAARELAAAGLTLSPRVFSTGTILYGAEGRVRADIQSLKDARRHLDRMQALGAFSVKSYNQPRREQRQQVLESARELGMLVMPEGGSLFHHNMTQVLDGHTGIEHAIPLAKLYQDVIQLWSATEVGYTPTFNVAYGGLMGEYYWYQESPVYANQRLRRFVPPRALDARARRPLTAPASDWNHIAVARSARDLMRAGVRVHAGAHGQREGLGMHWEMWSMHQGGFTPYEALRAATLHGAEYLGLDQDLGRVAPSYLADLAIIEGDPLHDLRQSERVRWVMLGGQLYDAQTLARLAPSPAPAPSIFFHTEGTQADEATERQAECGCHP